MLREDDPKYPPGVRGDPPMPLLPESPREASILRFSAMSAIRSRSYSDMPSGLSLSSPSSLSSLMSPSATAAGLPAVDGVDATAEADRRLGPEARRLAVAEVAEVRAAVGVVSGAAGATATALVASITALRKGFALDALVYALLHPCSAHTGLRGGRMRQRAGEVSVWPDQHVSWNMHARSNGLVSVLGWTVRGQHRPTRCTSTVHAQRPRQEWLVRLQAFSRQASEPCKRY